MKDIDWDLREIEWMQSNRKRQLTEFIKMYEMPWRKELFMPYHAKSAVEASKAQLAAMEKME